LSRRTAFISVKIRLLLSLRTVQKIKIILITLSFCLSHYLSAQDTITVPRAKKRIFSAEPMKATMLAIAFPGLGQIYNRKYWKVPFVYAGFGGLAYSVSFNTSKYNDMMKAYQDFTDKIPETNSYTTLPWLKATQPSEYDPVLYPDTYNPSISSWVEDNLIKSIDYYKKYRDLSYIGIAAWYLITVLDANVDASLSNFDISNDLNLEVAPLQLPVPGVTGAGLNISLIYTF
jgi:hypothetical protein